MDEQSEWRSFGADISSHGAKNDRNRIGNAISDLREGEGMGTLLVGNGELTNVCRKIDQSTGSNLGDKFDKNLQFHISKLKLESLKDATCKLFVEYKRKLNVEESKDEEKEISTRDLAFAFL